MRRLIAWLWLIPVPLTFGFDLVTGTGWPVIAGTVLAAAAVLPILVRIHAGRTPSRALRIAVLGLLVSLGFVAIAATLSLTVLWLSLITLALLGRFGARPRAGAPPGGPPPRAAGTAALRLLWSLAFAPLAAPLRLPVLWLRLSPLALLGRFGARPRASVAMATLARGRAPKRPSRARVIRLSH